MKNCHNCQKKIVQNYQKIKKMWKLWKIVKIVKTCQNCQNWSTLSKLSKIVKTVKNCENFGQVMFSHHYDQMSQGSQVSRVILKSKGDWVSEKVTHWAVRLLSGQLIGINWQNLKHFACVHLIMGSGRWEAACGGCPSEWPAVAEVGSRWGLRWLEEAGGREGLGGATRWAACRPTADHQLHHQVPSAYKQTQNQNKRRICEK